MGLTTAKFSFEDMLRRVEQTNRHILMLHNVVDKQSLKVDRCFDSQYFLISDIEKRLADADSIVLFPKAAPVLDDQRQHIEP
ncbi:hypothetical protein D9M69_662690 [compost metagenome]